MTGPEGFRGSWRLWFITRSTGDRQPGRANGVGEENSLVGLGLQPVGSALTPPVRRPAGLREFLGAEAHTSRVRRVGRVRAEGKPRGAHSASSSVRRERSSPSRPPCLPRRNASVQRTAENSAWRGGGMLSSSAGREAGPRF